MRVLSSATFRTRKKAAGGDGGNYRRNAARELERFAEWAAGNRGDDDWTGIVPDDVDREPTFGDLVERLYNEGVSTLYVADIKGILSTHWSHRVNEKTHTFWAHRRFINRLESICEG